MTTAVGTKFTATCSWVARNQDGRLEVAARGDRQACHNLWQITPKGDWATDWHSLGGTVAGVPVLVPDANGRLNVFIRDTDNRLGTRHQPVPNGGQEWSDWQYPAGNLQLAGDPKAVLRADGCLAVFARGTDNALWHIWQTEPNGEKWSDPVSLGGNLAGNPAVALNADGRLEVFARYPDGTIWHIYQETAPNRPWSEWSNLPPAGYQVKGDPAVALDVQGRLYVFALGTDDAFCFTWQAVVNNGWCGQWGPLGDKLQGHGVPAVAQTPDGHLHVYVRDTYDRILHCQQRDPNNPGWQQWQVLVPASDDPAVNLNADGSPEIFARLGTEIRCCDQNGGNQQSLSTP